MLRVGDQRFVVERNPPTVLGVRPVHTQVCNCSWDGWCLTLQPHLLLFVAPCSCASTLWTLPRSTRRCCPCRCRLKSLAGRWWDAGSVRLCRWATLTSSSTCSTATHWLQSLLQPCCLASSTTPCSSACSLCGAYLPPSDQCSVLLVQLAFADAETVRWQWFRSRSLHREQPDAATEDNVDWELMPVSGRVYQVSAADLGQRLMVECTAGRAQEG